MLVAKLSKSPTIILMPNACNALISPESEEYMLADVTPLCMLLIALLNSLNVDADRILPPTSIATYSKRLDAETAEGL